ncbi:MAG: CHRD domain-containing protein [Actinomycetota bacterium]
MIRKFTFVFATVFAVAIFSVLANAQTYFTGNMNAAQETPPTASTATGFGRVTLNTAETQITASFYYGSAAAPLTSNVTAGHIHTGAVGVAGPVTFNLAPATGVTFGSVVNSTFAVTPAQVADLKAGNMYFNIHTVNNPGGEIRGQITVDSPFIAYMDNNQENPPTASTARGSGAVSLNAAGTQALVTMNWSGLTGNPTGGHIHSSRVGTNGPVICPFTMPATTTGSVVDVLCTFTAAQVTALKTAQLYMNVHTAASPGGEIRGQIQRRRSTVLDFDGDSKTDFAIARNNTTSGLIEWWIANSGGGVGVFTLGVSAEFSTSRILAADFDGDGKDDATVWRSGATPAAGFLIFQSGNNTIRFEQFGTTGDDPRVTYDYDGDGRADPAVFRTSDDTWYYLGSSNNPNRNITFVHWGTTFPNPGDFDGDGKGDFVDQQSGNWWLLRSSDLSVRVIPIGTGSAFGVPGDYDGDGKTDVGITLTEGTQNAWYYASSLNPTQSPYSTRQAWGPSSGRTRAQGDYDGDGKSDYAVWLSGAPQTFWALPSNGSTPIIFQWGNSTTDFPIAGYNNR